MGEVIFSILMCARNNEETIQLAIDSARMQGCPKWEMIIMERISEDIERVLGE